MSIFCTSQKQLNSPFSDFLILTSAPLIEWLLSELSCSGRGVTDNVCEECLVKKAWSLKVYLIVNWNEKILWRSHNAGQKMGRSHPGAFANLIYKDIKWLWQCAVWIINGQKSFSVLRPLLPEPNSQAKHKKCAIIGTNISCSNYFEQRKWQFYSLQRRNVFAVAMHECNIVTSKPIVFIYIFTVLGLQGISPNPPFREYARLFPSENPPILRVSLWWKVANLPIYHCTVVLWGILEATFSVISLVLICRFLRSFVKGFEQCFGWYRSKKKTATFTPVWILACLTKSRHCDRDNAVLQDWKKKSILSATCLASSLVGTENGTFS